VAFLQVRKYAYAKAPDLEVLIGLAGWSIRLDDVATLAKHRLRLRPIVLKSLLGAGYQCLGDLRWVPGPQLTRLFYVGLKTARQIRTVVERLERDACISEE